MLFHDEIDQVGNLSFDVYAFALKGTLLISLFVINI